MSYVKNPSHTVALNLNGSLTDAADHLDFLAELGGQQKLKPESMAAIRTTIYKTHLEGGYGYEYRTLRVVADLLRTVARLEERDELHQQDGRAGTAPAPVSEGRELGRPASKRAAGKPLHPASGPLAKASQDDVEAAGECSAC